MNTSVLTDGDSDRSPGEALYRTLLEQAGYGVFVSDSGGRYLEANGKGCEMLGYQREEILRLSVKDLVPVEEQEEDRMSPKNVSAGQMAFVEHNLVRKNGSLLPVEINTHVLPNQNIIAIVHDVSRRKKTEEEIRHTSRLYATLSQVNQTIVRIKERKVLFRTICDVAVEYGEFDLAAIGVLDEKSETITLAAFKGSVEDKPCTIIEINTSPYDNGIIAHAIKSGKVVASDCLQCEESAHFWHDEAARRNLRSLAAVPFRLGDNVVGVLALASVESGYFGQKEKTLLEEIGLDISFALDMIELEAERAHAEQALKESEERYRSVYENTQIGLYRTSPDGRILMANPALIRMFGYDTFGQLAGRDLKQEGFEPNYSREEFIRRIDEEGEIMGLESAWTRTEGRAMYIRESARAVRDGEGNILYYEGSIEDITERKIAEQALRTSEDRFRTLFENAPVSLWEEDFSETKRKLDDLRRSGVRDISGYLRNNIDALITMFSAARVLSVNRTTLSLYHAVSVLQLMRASSSVSDPESGPAHVDTLVKIWEGQTAYDTETVIKTLTGEKRHIILRWRVVPGFEHDYSKMLVSMSDITALRNFERELEDSREMYRELVENIDEVIFSLDKDGVLLYVSPASERYFGAAYRTMIGSHFNSLVYPEDLPLIARHFEEQKRGHAKPFECRFVVKGGILKWGMVHPVAVFERGQLVGIRGSVLDITERKEAELKSLRLGEQLRALASGLQSAREEERMSIAREIHDELGQGLTTLKLGISLVRRSLLENRSSKKFLSEANELFELSRSVDGLVKSVRRISASLRPEVLDELGLAEAVRWYADQISRQSKIKCVVRINPPRIRLDESMSTVLFRICQEALTNVVRHSGASKAEVSLNKRSGKVKLTVKDNGSGISGENIQDKHSIGILGMKERALSIGGEFSVSRAGLKGTLVKVEVELNSFVLKP